MYLRLTGRDEEHVALGRGLLQEHALARPGRRRADLFADRGARSLRVEPSLAGRVGRRIACPFATRRSRSSQPSPSFGIDYGSADDAQPRSFPASDPMALASPGHEEVQATATVSVPDAGERSRRSGASWTESAFPRPRRGGDHRHHELHEHVEPAGDGRGRTARQEGGRARQRRPWVKSSLAPGSKVVTSTSTPRASRRISTSSASRPSATAARRASATRDRCRTRSRAISEGDLAVAAVLSGNRNFEARIHPEVKGEPRVAAASSPTRSPAAWTSTSWTSPRHRRRTARTCTSRTSGPACRRCRR